MIAMDLLSGHDSVLFAVFTMMMVGKSSQADNYQMHAEWRGVPHYAPIPPASYIVGGEEAVAHSWPWQALIRYDGHFTCGGTLVENDKGELVVVTAAHCVDGSLGTLSRWTVKLGMHHVSSDSAYTQSYSVRKITKHENYTATIFHNDIAIMFLRGSAFVSDGVIPACLASVDYSSTEICVATGWGKTSEEGELADSLQEVHVPLLSSSKCSGDLGESFKGSAMLCAGHTKGAKDACQGDSGGPLVCYRKGAWELTGIVSWGYGCGRNSLPGVYTDVWKFMKWIRRNWN